MIQVRCPSCQASFDTDERRIPKAGMRARCPKCGASIFVLPDGAASIAAPKPSTSSLDDLPATPGAVALPKPAAPPAAPSPAKDNLFALDDLPAPSKGDSMLLPAVRSDASSLDDPFGAGLPLPSTSAHGADRSVRPLVDLPTPSSAALPSVSSAALPATSGSALPAKPSAPLPSLSGTGLPATSRGPSLPTPAAPLPAAPVALPTPVPPPASPSPFHAQASPAIDLDLDGPPLRPPPSAAAQVPSIPSPGAPEIEPDPFAQPQRPVTLPSLDAVQSKSAPSAVTPAPAANKLPRGAPRDLDFSEPAPLLPPARPPSVVLNAVQPSHESEPQAPVSFPPPKAPSAEFAAVHAPPPPSTSPHTSPSSPARAPGAPGPARGSTPTLGEHFDLPLPPAPEAPVRRGGMGFGEIDLGGDSRPSSPGEADEFDQIPVEGASGASSATTSIETDGPARPGLATPPRSSAAPKTSEATKTKPARKGLVVGVGFLAAVVLTGAGLSFTSAGPFGATAIDQALHGAERRAAANAAVQAARRLLSEDTFGASRRALRQLDDQLARTPKEPELVAYAAFANYFVLARFGSDATIAGRARALFEKLPTLPSGTDYLGAAQAARELSQGHPERVRRLRSGDPAVQDLEVMASIDQGAQDALEKARAAATSRRATRTRFLLARALYLSDDRASALREAESLITEVPQHAGARLLAAKILSSHTEQVSRALALASEVEALANAASTDEKVEAAVLIGDVELNRERLAPAREAYERALAIDPRAPSALVGVAKVLYQQRAFSDALAKFTAAVTADPNDVEAVLGVGMASIALGRHAEVRPRLEALAQAHPNDAKVRFWLARALLASNDRPAAERELREATRLDDSMLEAYTTLASMLFAAQRPQEAEQVLERARGRVADQAAIRRALGEGRFARGDIAGAEAELRAAVQGRPEDLRTRMLLAQVLRQRRSFDDAARELDAISRIDAEYPGLLPERGLLLQARGDAQGAVSIFRTALARDANNSELLVHLGAALVAAGAFDEAERQVTPVVDQQPNMAEAHYVLGRAKLGRGNIVEAIRLLERATELDATRADYRAYAAEANMLRAQFTRALEHAHQACAADPNYARGFWIRGEIRVRQHQARDALLDARRALEIDPMLADAMVTYAEADMQLGQPAAALELYRRALVLAPDQAEWRARYARLFADAGRDAEALRELEQACRIGDNLPAPPPWLADAHRLAGEVAFRARRRDAARQHYRRFVDLAAPGTAGLDEARRVLQELGG